jgi:hypothetical protein
MINKNPRDDRKKKKEEIHELFSYLKRYYFTSIYIYTKKSTGGWKKKTLSLGLTTSPTQRFRASLVEDFPTGCQIEVDNQIYCGGSGNAAIMDGKLGFSSHEASPSVEGGSGIEGWLT